MLEALAPRAFFVPKRGVPAKTEGSFAAADHFCERHGSALGGETMNWLTLAAGVERPDPAQR